MKYINNSIRGYEFWEFYHYTPFWDKDLLDFWSKVPFEQIMSKKLYKKYLLKESKRVSLFPGEEICREKPYGKIRKSLTAIFRQFLRNSILMNAHIFRRILIKVKFSAHPLCFYSIYTELELEEYMKKGYFGIIGIHSYEYIKKNRN